MLKVLVFVNIFIWAVSFELITCTFNVRLVHVIEMLSTKVIILNSKTQINLSKSVD